MPTLRYVIADVFTDTPLAGNGLAVFTDGRGLETEQMQRLAREMNLSETVFVLPPESDGHARMRIFTPATELPFAGHPTLGTAFVLAAPLQLSVIKLETKAGVVPVALEREGSRIVFGRMEQPLPTLGAVRGRGRAASRAARRAERAADRALRQRHAERVRRARLRGRGGRAAA